MCRVVSITLFSAVIIVMRVFFDGKDYAFYLQQLQISAEQSGVAVHAFVLMINYMHSLVTPSAANSKLFADVIPVNNLDQIRECTNKSWVLGSSKFKAQIESAANRRIESLGWGGDRKSKRVTDQGV
jgi:hypothetical protein